MAQMTLCERCGRTSLWRWSDAAAAFALWRHTSRGWRLGCGGWLGLVWLGSLAGPAQDAAAQADSRTIEAQVNLPYALQYGFGTYDVGGLSVYTLRVPVPHTFALAKLAITSWLIVSFDTTGEVVFAAASTLTFLAFNGLPSMRWVYF